jgi:hypothetical protein
LAIFNEALVEGGSARREIFISLFTGAILTALLASSGATFRYGLNKLG